MSDVSALFGLLADVHRRRILFALCDAESVRVPDDLTSRGSTGGSPLGGSGPSNDVGRERADRRLRIELHHVHLPKLADAGLVEWDREAGTVARGPAFDEVEPVLQVLDRNRDALPGPVA